MTDWRARAVALSRRAPDWTGRFTRLADLTHPEWLAIPLFWFALIVPAIFLRGYHYEEGTIVALARGAIEDGQWLAPHQYGFRFIERPVLMSWLLAVLGLIFGEIRPWIARILPTLSLLGGGFLVFYLTRQRASAAAALFGALCFLICPAVLQKLVTAEPDVMLSVLLFSTFVVWWDGQKTGRVSAPRWLAVAAIFAAAGLTKGPQPMAYFTLGVGSFLLLRRQWHDVPAFIFVNALAGGVVLAWYLAVYRSGDFAIWENHSRIDLSETRLSYYYGIFLFIRQFALEALPSLIVVVALVVDRIRKHSLMSDAMVLALLCYASATTLALAVWPEGNVRYAMPAMLALATLAGLGYDHLRVAAPHILNAAVGLAFVLAAYALVVGWIVMPLLPASFQQSAVIADKMMAQMRAEPAPLYGIFESFNNNIAAYLPPPVRLRSMADIAKLTEPAWLYISPEEAEQVRNLRPDLSIEQRLVVHFGTDADFYRAQAK